MAMCFNTPTRPSTVLISHSYEESDSSSSSHYHSPTSSPPDDTHTHYNLTVTNLSYTIHKTTPLFPLFPNPNQINILKSVSFQARSSELFAVMGPSGTGKSTLLRAISGRLNPHNFNPQTISINNQTLLSSAQLRLITGYVSQQDDLLPLLTVRETLMFSAQFRLRDSAPRDREARVESLILDLGLAHVAHAFVGDAETRGVSGGEMKRVCIGVEIIHDPPILVLDEPTSGLDSTSALHVIELLHTMAKSDRRTIVLSIHQPSFRILKLVSEFLIISRGSVAHRGTIADLEDRIARLGYQIPIQINAVEFAMEIITELELEEEGVQFPRQIGQLKQECSNKFNWEEIGFLCWRFWKIMYRTKQLLLARVMQAIIGGLGLGSVYLQVKKDPGGVSERLGLFAFSLSFLLSSTVEALPIYLQERKVIMKEMSTSSYKISSYLLANTLVLVPFLFLVSVLFSIPVYWIVGLNPAPAAFAFFVFVVWLILLVASSLVLFFSAVSPDFVSGNSLVCTALGAFFLFSGYFIPKESIPKNWMFMYYVSLYRYPLNAMLVNEYWSEQDECFSWGDGDRSRCLMSGRDVLMARGLANDCRWMNVGIMLGFFVFYRVVCWIVLVRRACRTIY